MALELVTAPVLPSHLFSYDKETAQFTAFISDLAIDNQPLDSLRMISARTGRIVKLELIRREYDGEGELVAWLFRLTGVPGVTVRIFND